MPDRRAGEANNGADSKLCCGPGGGLDFFGCAAAYAFGIAVAPDAGRKDATVPNVDGVVTDGLTGEVAGDRENAQPITVERFAPSFDVHVVGDRFVHFKVVSPAGDFQPVVSPAGGKSADFFKRQVGELSSE